MGFLLFSAITLLDIDYLLFSTITVLDMDFYSSQVLLFRYGFFTWIFTIRTISASPLSVVGFNFRVENPAGHCVDLIFIFKITAVEFNVIFFPAAIILEFRSREFYFIFL